jgi:hypothetical protein
MTRHISYDAIATTEIEGNPVIRCEIDDVGSWMHVVVDREDDILRVTHVESHYPGDMSLMLDETVSQLEMPHVRFMIPLGGDLPEKLNGFDLIEEDVEGPDGWDTVEALDGRWVVDASE